MPASRKAAPKLSIVKGLAKGRGTPARATSVRWDRVRNARARISVGHYDQPEVRERVMTAVLDEMDES